nr:VOC family protein [Maliibacterium massiliense]
MIDLRGFDHVVITVTDVEKTMDFYTQVLGMHAQGNSLFFGNQCIKVHRHPAEFLPAARKPISGSADICLIAQGEMSDIVEYFVRCNVPVEEGPVWRTGARGDMTSVYVRDPDGNLIEICVYDD